MRPRYRIQGFALAAALLLASARAPAAQDTVDLRLLAINDFHGNLEGAVALAATLRGLRGNRAQALLVSAGDLIGASPLPSALQHDEPILALFDRLGLQANAIGNHELDGGLAELQRQQKLVAFPFLSANLVDAGTGKPVFPAYRIVEVEGIRLALVGATVRNALKPLEPELVPGLRLDDEAVAINAQVAALRAQGVHAIVVLLHEGAEPAATGVAESDCGGLAGPARDITAKLDADVDLVLSAHTHRVYACRLDGRWLTQAGVDGHYVTAVDLQLDRASGKARVLAARNVAVAAVAAQRDEIQSLVDDAVQRAAKVGGEAIATLPGGRVSAQADARGGSPLGRMVAQAQLAAGAPFGAQLACTNPSSLPRDLVASKPGNIATYADLRAAQPYGNRLKLREVSGAQLRALLEQQWRAGAGPALLSCSPGFSYRFDESRPIGERVDPASLRLGKHAIAEKDTLRMVVNSYLARGGQGFGALVDSRQLRDVGTDLDALLAWLRK